MGHKTRWTQPNADRTDDQPRAGLSDGPARQHSALLHRIASRNVRGRGVIPLAQQIEEIELSCLALANLIARAKRGEIKRPPEWIDRREKKADAMWAALETLRRVAGEKASAA